MPYEYNVYVLKNPKMEQVFYVGMFLGVLKTRLNIHINSSYRLKGDRHLYIKNLVDEGFPPEIESIERFPVETPRNEVLKAEKKWIDFYLKKGIDLLNIQGNPQRDTKEYRKRVYRGRPKKVNPILEQTAKNIITMTEKKKRGRPKKIASFEELKEHFDPPAIPDVSQIQKEAKEAVKEFHKGTDYNPFDNPRFKAKMGLSDKKDIPK